MSDKPRKTRGLGRGLSALMADVALDPASGATPPAPERTLPIELLEPNPEQPRKHFAQPALQELTESIRTRGILQPLIVRPSPRSEGRFEIVAGERRWRAAQAAQLHEVPVILRDLGDTDVLEIAIVENIQRADLSPIEEALGFRQLIERFGHTQEQLATALGKSRSHIANLLRLLNLPSRVQDMVASGELSAGHARALVTVPNPEELAQRIVARGLSVRETERLVKVAGEPSERPRAPTPEKDADTRALEQDLSAALGLTLKIDHKPDGSGRLSIAYGSLDDLDRLCRVLSAPPHEDL